MEHAADSAGSSRVTISPITLYGRSACEQHSSLENKPVAIDGPRQPKEEPLEHVGQQQFLGPSTAPTCYLVEVEIGAPRSGVS